VEKKMPDEIVGVKESFVLLVSKALRSCRESSNGHITVFIPDDLTSQEIQQARRILESAGFNTERNGNNALNVIKPI